MLQRAAGCLLAFGASEVRSFWCLTGGIHEDVIAGKRFNRDVCLVEDWDMLSTAGGHDLINLLSGFDAAGISSWNKQNDTTLADLIIQHFALC